MRNLSGFIRCLILFLSLFGGVFSTFICGVAPKQDLTIKIGEYRSLDAFSKMKKVKDVFGKDLIKEPDSGNFPSERYVCRIDPWNYIEIYAHEDYASPFRFTFTGPKFKTDRGIKIGDTFAQVKKKYPDGVAEYSGDEGGYLVIMVKKENIIFSFNRDEIEARDNAGKITNEFLNQKKLESILLRDLREPLPGPVF